MNIDSGIPLKHHASCNFMLKYYITILLRQFTKTLNQFLNLSRINKNWETCMSFLFQQLNESKQFSCPSLDNVLIKGPITKQPVR